MFYVINMWYLQQYGLIELWKDPLAIACRVWASIWFLRQALIETNLSLSLLHSQIWNWTSISSLVLGLHVCARTTVCNLFITHVKISTYLPGYIGGEEVYNNVFKIFRRNICYLKWNIDVSLSYAPCVLLILCSSFSGLFTENIFWQCPNLCY